MYELERLDEVSWQISASARADMRVPARVLADDKLLEGIRSDRSLEQLVNVATLPGVVDYAVAMPDIHQGYGFPVGGVCATSLTEGVVSPGGVGYDINCGVRLLSVGISAAELADRRTDFVHELARRTPSGAGNEAGLKLSPKLLERVLCDGPRALVNERGIGTSDDVALCESEGRIGGADPTLISRRARERGAGQLGTLGSGNHFLEVGEVSEIFDRARAQDFGLERGLVCVLIHSGSRGLGHQVCSDYVKRMDKALRGYAIKLCDRQLSCAPVDSLEGSEYLRAMAAAANFAWANRHAIAAAVRETATAVLGGSAAQVRTIYDVAHNVAKIETHGGRRLCVHRKGATRAFGAHHQELPDAYRASGQPVFIPGSMGTSSLVLAASQGADAAAFGTTCHGAGRRMSRTAARKQITGAELRGELEAKGIVVRCRSDRGLTEEAPFAYKEVDSVVSVVEQAGLATRVARLRPLGVVKG